MSGLPVPYIKNSNFNEDATNEVSGREMVKPDSLDQEFSGVQQTTDSIIENVNKIIRSDGRIKDLFVELHSLSPDVLALFKAEFSFKGAWATTTAYIAGQSVVENAVLYLCLASHTSGVFATDLSGNLWGRITSEGEITSVAADLAALDVIVTGHVGHIIGLEVDENDTDTAKNKFVSNNMIKAVLESTANNLSTNADPTSSSDSDNTDGKGVFSINSIWTNTSTKAKWICENATATTAVWKEVVTLDSSGKIPALDGSQLTNLPVSKDWQKALALAVNNLFEIARNHDLPEGVAGNGFFDEFNTDSLVTQTGVTYDATNDLYENAVVGVNACSDMTSNSAPSGTVSASTELAGSPAFEAFDRDTAQFWATNSVTTGSITYAFNNGLTAKIIDEYTIQCELSPEHDRAPKDFTLQASNTGAFAGEEVTLDTQAGIVFSSGEKKSFSFSNSTSYIFYKIGVTLNNGDPTYITISEVELIEADSANNVTLLPANKTIIADPTDLRFDFIINEIDALTLGTDLTVKGSRDGGTTLSLCTLTRIGTLPGGESHIMGEVDVTGQPSGTAMKFQLESFNNKRIELMFANQLPIYS